MLYAMEAVSRKCPHCGKSFHGHKLRIYCSNNCKARANDARAKEAGRPWTLPKPKPVYPGRECAGCSATFTAVRKRQRLCGDLECAKAYRARLYREKYNSDNEYRRKVLDSRIVRRGGTPRELERSCVYCGCDISELQASAVMCRRCHGTVYVPPSKRKSTELVPYRRPLFVRGNRNPIPALNRDGDPRVFTAGVCVVCGKGFIAVGAGRTDRTCSVKCGIEHRESREHLRHATRRRRQAAGGSGQRIYRKKVFQRDGYRCYLCGRLTDPNVEKDNQLYPSLDHVIPLTKGGSHTYDNVATTHRLCNSMKRDLLLEDVKLRDRSVFTQAIDRVYASAAG